MAALYAWLAWSGITEISGSGAAIDSDLQTYAQSMAGEHLRANFSSDPVLSKATPANSIANLQSFLGAMLAPPGQWAIGLLRAGAVAIFIFYCGWYALGRWLFRSPALAALLACLAGITVWTGWGTFWGIAHSDPVPRVFFAALLPYILLLALIAVKKLWLRPVVLGLCGLCMWVHGVSALNCGAMLFTAFVFLRRSSWQLHLGNLFLCLLAFFAPVLAFLWPSLSQGGAFTPEELAMFRELFDLRWEEDYSDFGRRLLEFMSPDNPAFPILALGVPAWLVCFFRGGSHTRLLALFTPGCCLGLFCVTAFCWAESHYAPALGRLPMGHELVRGLRLLIPLAWLLISGAIGCLAGLWLRRILLVTAMILIFSISKDRQFMAAQYALSARTSLPLPLAQEAERERQRAVRILEFAKKIEATVPAGQSIYCPEDAMQVRYLALRPLAHSFKDGYVHFYNKDAKASRRWLKLEKLARSEPDGWLAAWRESGADWLLCRKPANMAALHAVAKIELEQDGWLLARKADVTRQ